MDHCQYLIKWRQIVFVAKFNWLYYYDKYISLIKLNNYKVKDEGIIKQIMFKIDIE